MKKIIIAAVMLVAINSITTAQNVGIGTNAPAASALLDVNASNKGVLIPRITNAQMLAIASPANGLLVYNTDSAAFAYRNATAWVFLKGNNTASNDWSTKGNAGTDTSKNFIGTTDNVDLIFKRNNLRAGLISINNTSWGNTALNPATTGSHNTANGFRALYLNSTGSFNTANGAEALLRNTTGINNTANGRAALFFNTTGDNNTATGTGALVSNGTGYSNVAMGINALHENTNRSNLVAIGDSALYNNSTGTTDNTEATKNTAVGSKALFSNNTGYNNTANGYESLKANSIGYNNTAVGGQALGSNNIGSRNTATGFAALYSNISGNENAANGTQALLNNIDGSGNTAMGFQSLFSNGSGFSNVAIGAKALYGNTNRSNLVAIGDSALFNNGTGASNPLHANGNTGIGSKALYLNTIGNANTATGFQALFSNSTGSYNTANGIEALFSNVSGSSNTATGRAALKNNNGGNDNTATGTGALLSNSSGNSNTAMGVDALHNNVFGNNNTANGYHALYNNTGSLNTANGYGADVIASNLTNTTAIGANAKAGRSNSLILGDTSNVNVGIGTGYPGTAKLVIKTTAGQNGIDLASSDAYAEMRVIRNTLNATDKDLYLGFLGPAGSSVHLYSDGIQTVLVKSDLVGVGKAPLTTDNDSRLQVKQKGFQSGIGVEASGNTNHWDYYVTGGASSNFSLFYNGSIKGTFDNVTGDYTAASDRRLKKDITPQQPVLSNVMQLQAYQYHYLDNQPTDRFSNGFMAQDVQKIFPDAVVENEMKDGEKRLGINYQYFTVLAIKGLQEQQKDIEQMKEQMKMMMGEIERLKKK